MSENKEDWPARRKLDEDGKNMEKIMIFGSETNEKEVNLKWIELYRKIRLNFNDTFIVINRGKKEKEQWILVYAMDNYSLTYSPSHSFSIYIPLRNNFLSVSLYRKKESEMDSTIPRRSTQWEPFVWIQNCLSSSAQSSHIKFIV